MASRPTQPTWDPLVLAGQLQTIATRSQLLMPSVVSNATDVTKFGLGDTSTLGFDFLELITRMMSDPVAVASVQIDLCKNTLGIWQKTAERMFMLRTHEADAQKDKRFKHPQWSEKCHLWHGEGQLSRDCEKHPVGNP